MFNDPDKINRFLVADEVGLGKTLVARGVIARVIAHLQTTHKNIDIIYICSNHAIASQNLKRLNVMNDRARIISTRMTLVPFYLKRNTPSTDITVNFICLTPNTTFKLRSSGGTTIERALIFQLLVDGDIISHSQFTSRIFRGRVKCESWTAAVESASRYRVTKSFEQNFLKSISNELRTRIQQLCQPVDNGSDISPVMRKESRSQIRDLRMILVELSIDFLNPNLIILDEFQRFNDLLTEKNSASDMARRLFEHEDKCGQSTKLLLLSATPYRMLTVSKDFQGDGNHYDEFIKVLKFLFEDNELDNRYVNIIKNLSMLRKEIECVAKDFGHLHFQSGTKLKEDIERDLLKVMARTEKVSGTREFDAMITNVRCLLPIRYGDLIEIRALEKVAGAIHATKGDKASQNSNMRLIEYWKSCPWILNFMHSYEIFKGIKKLRNSPPNELTSAMKKAIKIQFDQQAMLDYRQLTPPNARMRQLAKLAMDKNMAQRLWIPPSLPYFGTPTTASKFLVFSDWGMVPNAISGFLSYEAERSTGFARERVGYRSRSKSGPLKFKMTSKTSKNESLRLEAGLRILQLVIPSPTLARVADPLELASCSSLSSSERTPFKNFESLAQATKKRLRSHSDELFTKSKDHKGDPNWKWVSSTALDISCPHFSKWLESNIANEPFHTGSAKSGTASSMESWYKHMMRLKREAKRPTVNVKPGILLSHLTDVALGSPATCALRALSRVFPCLPMNDDTLLTAASKIGMAFITLFNRPESCVLIRRKFKVGSKNPYWRAVLHYVARNDLQSVLDEYVHILSESEGQLRTSSVDTQRNIIKAISKVIIEALTFPSSTVKYTHYSLKSAVSGVVKIQMKRTSLRTRFAARITQKGESEGRKINAGSVRTAFNSPFQPFVLSTTSIGQEGLDFHQYCHKVVHWNLPKNPVDLEQRDGRVHRYKNHAVRINVANSYYYIAFRKDVLNPWFDMFDAADSSSRHKSDLDPFWIHTGPSMIERHILMLPFSREAARCLRLLRSVAVYRLIFGQSRQEELFTLLDMECNSSEDKKRYAQLQQLQICLKPVLPSIAKR